MSIEAAIRRSLIELDIATFRKAEAAACPGRPPLDDAKALIVMHIARTEKQTIPEKYRLRSHAWLRERGIPSALPDRLKPKADRLYPTAVDGVMVIVRSSFGSEVGHSIQGAMVEAVEDCYANGDRDPSIVKPQMMRARFRERKALGLPALPDVPMDWKP